jgi:hypothetical protein
MPKPTRAPHKRKAAEDPIPIFNPVFVETKTLASNPSEAVTHHFESVQQSKVITVVPKDDRIGSDALDMEEFTAIVGIRASEIEASSRLFKASDDPSPIVVAIEEIRAKMNPYSVVRHFGNGLVEIWDVNELDMPPFI